MATPALRAHPSVAQGADVRAERLVRFFAERRVLHELDLQVQSGSFVAVIGASGSGKTTLLRLLAGLDRPDGGRLSASTPAGAALTLADRVLVLRDGHIVRDAAVHAPCPRARRNEELLCLREELEGALRLS